MTDADGNAELTSRTGAFVGLLLLPVYLLVAHFSGDGTARAATIAAGMIVGAAWAFRARRHQVWYSATLATLVAIHLLLLFVVPWTARVIPGPALWPAGILDFLLVFGGMAFVGKHFSEPST